jgi:hypothetical protein
MRRIVLLSLFGLGLVLVIFYAGPLFLIHHRGALTPEQRLKAINDARTSLATVLSAIGLTGGLLFTASTFRLSRTGQNTDRYQAAIAQLGDDRLTVRVGGIHALEKLSVDVRSVRQTVADVLASFIRDSGDAARCVPSDVQVAITVLGRSAGGTALRPPDLSGAALPKARLRQANLDGVDLTGAHLQGADLSDASLHRAALAGARLNRANLSNADLTDADLTDADLRNAILYRSDLSGATLTRCRLRGCDPSAVQNLSPVQRRAARL